LKFALLYLSFVLTQLLLPLQELLLEVFGFILNKNLYNKIMSKFEYIAFGGEGNGWETLSVYAKKLKETPKIKQIKSAKNGPQTKALNIMGQHGWELITVPQMGHQLLVFKKKI